MSRPKAFQTFHSHYYMALIIASLGGWIPTEHYELVREKLSLHGLFILGHW